MELYITVYSRGSVEIKAAFVLDVEHQVTSIQVLHYKEEMLLCKQHIIVSSVLQTLEKRMNDRMTEDEREWIQIRGAEREVFINNWWSSGQGNVEGHVFTAFTSRHVYRCKLTLD